MAATAPYTITSGACSTGVDVDITVPDNVIAIQIKPDGGDITLKDASGNSFPLADGETFEWQDRNLPAKKITVRGSTGTTVYLFCATGLAQ